MDLLGEHIGKKWDETAERVGEGDREGAFPHASRVGFLHAQLKPHHEARPALFVGPEPPDHRSGLLGFEAVAPQYLDGIGRHLHGHIG